MTKGNKTLKTPYKSSNHYSLRFEMDDDNQSDSESEGFWNNNTASITESERDFMITNKTSFSSTIGFSDANIPLYEGWFNCLPVHPKKSIQEVAYRAKAPHKWSSFSDKNIGFPTRRLKICYIC